MKPPDLEATARNTRRLARAKLYRGTLSCRQSVLRTVSAIRLANVECSCRFLLLAYPGFPSFATQTPFIQTSFTHFISALFETPGTAVTNFRLFGVIGGAPIWHFKTDEASKMDIWNSALLGPH